MAHTPGPWEIDWDCHTAINKGNKHIALVNQYNSTDESSRVWGEEHEANARLIAAAPDLLARLKEARDAIASLEPEALGEVFTQEPDGTQGGWPIRDELLANIDNDISKAKGE